MKTLKIIIEKGEDMYAAYAENAEGIYGMGETPEEAKSSVLKSIELTIKNNASKNIPTILKGEYEIIYQYDVESLLKYYKGIISNPAFEKLTGINQKLIHQYSTGLKKPRPAQRKKIEKGLHNLGKELIAIEL